MPTQEPIPPSTITLRLSKKLESQNRIGHHRHWRVAHADKQAWLMHVLAAMKPWMHDSHGERRKRVVITSYRTRLLDKGNLYGGAKGLLDALVHFGLIRDDSVKWIDEEVRQVQVKKVDLPEAQTVVEITDL